MIGGIGIGEMMVILLVILLLFGAKRLPEIARAMGNSIFEFKKAVNTNLSDIKQVFEEDMSKKPSAGPVKQLKSEGPDK